MYGGKRYMVTGEVTGNREVTNWLMKVVLLVVHTAQSDNNGHELWSSPCLVDISLAGDHRGSGAASLRVGLVRPPQTASPTSTVNRRAHTNGNI
jgi:hypothetical protein